MTVLINGYLLITYRRSPHLGPNLFLFFRFRLWNLFAAFSFVQMEKAPLDDLPEATRMVQVNLKRGVIIEMQSVLPLGDSFGVLMLMAHAS